jgi:hypothetical protein
VTAASGSSCEVKGYTFVFRSGSNEYRRRPELRTRVFSLGDAGHIVNKIPAGADIGALQYRMVDKRLVITDLAGFTLDINEFGAER